MAVMKRKKIPKYITPCLWPYDTDKLDLQKDKELIITQVLNRGDMKRIKWLYSTYGEEEIKKVITNPGRGMWSERVLNFWEIVLGICLPKKVREKAISSHYPNSPPRRGGIQSK